MKEAWYRYFANAGTFHAHRYLGEKSGDLAEMKTARAMIKRAIEIKPNAHFGREKYQLMAMDWIVATKAKRTQKSLADFISTREKWDEDAPAGVEIEKMRAASEGLSGLIVLGAAWQSVDIFHVLASSLNTKSGITLSHLALLRTQELLKQGRKSLAPQQVNASEVRNELLEGRSLDYESGINDKNQKTLDNLFPKLRAEAENWNTQRQNYTMARLQKGDHPDTNPKFWAGWKPASPPSLEVNWFNEVQEKQNFINRSFLAVQVASALLLSSILALTFWLIRRAAKRKIRV